jgi:hypothetical protein
MQLLPSIDGPSLYPPNTQPMQTLRRGLIAFKKPSSAFLQRQGFTEERLKRYKNFIESLTSKGHPKITQEELIELSITKEVISGILEILKIPPVPLQWAPPFTEKEEEKALNTALKELTQKIQGFIQKQQETLPKQYGYTAPHFDLDFCYAQMRDSIFAKITPHAQGKSLESIESEYLRLSKEWSSLLTEVKELEQPQNS